ncbi:MAG: biotin transporter BioY [Acidobacteriota bacterium]
MRIRNRIAWIVLMAVLMAAGAQVSVPMVPVPMSLQTLFVLLAGFVLGPVDGALAAVVYLAAGALGLPVFAGGSAGFATLLGPTGGFLVSFVAMAAAAGLAVRGRPRALTWKAGLIVGGAASLLAFVVGVPWLKIAAEIPWTRAFEVGMLPFLPGAVVKLLLAVALARFLRARLARESTHESAASGWRRVFGQASLEAVAEVDAIVADEFNTIDPDT